MKFKTLVLGAAVFFTNLTDMSSVLAFEGRVVSYATGQPLPNVWVVGRWEKGAAHASGCVLAISKADQAGNFILENRDGLFGWLFPTRSEPAIEFYARGFQRFHRSREPGSLFMIEPETGNSFERIESLVQLLSFTDCGRAHSDKHKAALLPLYQNVNEEAQSIASSTSERRLTVTTQVFVDELLIGYEEAARKAKAASEAIR
jgi:hypothetical protein